MRIDVTQADIDRARDLLAKNAAIRAMCCPIAEAVKRITGNWAVIVLCNTIQVAGETYKMPIEARRFVWDFDAGREVRPIQFEASR